MEEVQSWWEVPTIAHFCSLFRAAFTLLDFDIEDLEEALLCNGEEEANPFLVDLLVRLLSGCYQRNDLDVDNYHKYLKDFIKHRWIKEKGKETNLQDESFQALSLRHKVELLHTLCDARLDAPDVAEVLKNLEADSLRVEPLGQDESGATYWYFYGTRLYKEMKINQRKQKERLRRKRGKEKKHKRDKRRKTKGKKGRGQKQDVDSSSDENDEEAPSSNASNGTGWSVMCSTEEEWKDFAENFKKSKHRCERDLYRTLTVDFLPEIGNMIAEKEKQQKKKLLEIAPRRSSQRIERLRQQREEEVASTEERMATLTETSEEGQPSQIQEREKKPCETKSREERFMDRQVAKEERARRAQMREERAQLIAEGKELPASLKSTTGSFLRKRRYDLFLESDEDIYIGMFKVFDAVKSHKDSWPFLQPVDEAFAPGYYDIVKQPMDLSTVEKKLQGKQYKDKDEFEKDVMLMLDNCRKYNGIESDYTRLSAGLQNAFEKAKRKYFLCDSSEDDEEPPTELEEPKSEKKVNETPPKPMLLKHSGVKAMEMLAQVAEQALQKSSKRAAVAFSQNTKKMRPLILGRKNATPTANSGQGRVIYIQRKPTGNSPQAKIKIEGVTSRPPYTLNVVSKTSDGIMIKPVQPHQLAGYRQARTAASARRDGELSGTKHNSSKDKITFGVLRTLNDDSGLMTLMEGKSIDSPSRSSLAGPKVTTISATASQSFRRDKVPGASTTGTISFAAMPNAVSTSAKPMLENITTSVLKAPVMYCQLPVKTPIAPKPSGQITAISSIPVKKRATSLVIENVKATTLPGCESSSATFHLKQSASHTKEGNRDGRVITLPVMKLQAGQNCSTSETAATSVSNVLITSANASATATTALVTNASTLTTAEPVVEGLAEKLQMGSGSGMTTTSSLLSSNQSTSGVLRTVMLSSLANSKPTVIVTAPKSEQSVDVKAQQKTVIAQAPIKAPVTTLSSTACKLNTVPQGSTAVQYTVSFGQNVKSSVPTTVQPTSVVAIANSETYAPTQIQLAPTYTESAKVSSQYHYVDPSTIQLATLSPGNMVPLAIKAEPSPSPQLFYVQHQGHLVIQQQYQQNHNLQLVPSTVTTHPALSTSKTILLPAGSQPTFLTSQPATVAAHIPNGTMQYYSGST